VGAVTMVALAAATGAATPSVTPQRLSLGKNFTPQFTVASVLVTLAARAVVMSSHLEGHFMMKQARLNIAGCDIDSDRSSTMRTSGGWRSSVNMLRPQLASGVGPGPPSACGGSVVPPAPGPPSAPGVALPPDPLLPLLPLLPATPPPASSGCS